MLDGQSVLHDTKCHNCNCKCKIVGRRVIFCGTLTRWSLGDMNNISNNIQSYFSNWWLCYYCEIALRVIVTASNWWKVNIGSGNGLVAARHPSNRNPILSLFPYPLHHDYSELSTNCVLSPYIYMIVADHVYSEWYHVISKLCFISS